MRQTTSFRNEHISRKEFFKTNAKEIFEDDGYEELTDLGDLPEDTSNVFFILKKKRTRAVNYEDLMALKKVLKQ
ncbi:MAG: hypothetical protein IJ899_05145 [Blautia sp.]|nr:hypothetical protein [Blautia sp.]